MRVALSDIVDREKRQRWESATCINRQYFEVIEMFVSVSVKVTN